MKTANSNASHTAKTTGAVSAAPKWQLGLVLLLGFLSFALTAAESGRVKLVRTPDDGIQPQAAVDSQGAVHLIGKP